MKHSPQKLANATTCLSGALLLCCTMSSFAQKMDNSVPMGWAIHPGYNEEGITGGHNGRVVTATTSEELKRYCGSDEPLVIIADGSFSGTIPVKPNKTIIGAGNGATHLGGFQLGNNVILRNFKISGGGDAIQIEVDTTGL